jgi:hypothetical protein
MSNYFVFVFVSHGDKQTGLVSKDNGGPFMQLKVKLSYQKCFGLHVCLSGVVAWCVGQHIWLPLSLIPTQTRGGFHTAIYALRLNLRSAPILFAQIYYNLASCICALRSTYCIFYQIWVRSTLYVVRPTFMKSTPGCKYSSFSYHISRTLPLAQSRRYSDPHCINKHCLVTM